MATCGLLLLHSRRWSQVSHSSRRSVWNSSQPTLPTHTCPCATQQKAHSLSLSQYRYILSVMQLFVIGFHPHASDATSVYVYQNMWICSAQKRLGASSCWASGAVTAGHRWVALRSPSRCNRVSDKTFWAMPWSAVIHGFWNLDHTFSMSCFF